MATNHFPFVGAHFKTSWDSKRTAIPLALGHPIGAGSALLAGESKGDTLPWQWFPKAAALPWREESKGGQHTAAVPAEFGFNQYVSTSGKSTPIGCAFLIDMAFETGLEQF